MTSPEISRLVNLAARYKRHLEKLHAHSDKIELRLQKVKDQLAALVPATADLAVAPTTTAGGGSSWKFEAANGLAVRVTQPAAKLLGKISGDLLGKLRGLTGEHFPRLFITHATCAPKFREQLFRTVEKSIATEVLSLVEEPSKATVTVG